MRKDGTWRMKEPCADCPFNSTGPGRELRRSLDPGRWRYILAGLRSDHHFICHNTASNIGDGSELLCAGAIAWQAKRGLSSQMQRWMERIDSAFRERRRQGR